MTPVTLAECAAEIARHQAAMDALVGQLMQAATEMNRLAEALECIRDRMRQEVGP